MLATVTSARSLTLYVDGGCPQSGDGSTLVCGANGPLRTINEGIEGVAGWGGVQPIRIVVRGLHDGFDGVYSEYVKLWGAQALNCAPDVPCVIEGCPASECGADETPIVSGFDAPLAGWTSSGFGANAVYSRSLPPHGQAAEPAGVPQGPPDGPYGAGAGRFNPMYVLEGADRHPLGFGGSCGADFTTPCGDATQCPAGVACVANAPPDGFWSMSCTGSPVASCLAHVNPTGEADPRAGHRIWIPNRNALLLADGRATCPAGEGGCLPTRYLTLRRFVFEGSRWVGVNLQNDDARESGSVVLKDVTIRHAPKVGLRVQRVFDLVLSRVTVEHMGRGLSTRVDEAAGVQLVRPQRGRIDGLTVRHLGSAGRGDGVTGAPLSCPACDAPWHLATSTSWGARVDAVDVRYARTLSVEGIDVTDVNGGVSIDASFGVTLDGGTISRSRHGIVVHQANASANEGALRSHGITVRHLRIDRSGDAEHGAINLGVGGATIDRCLSVPQSGEILRVYGNFISRPGRAGVRVCTVPRMCTGGARDRGACAGDDDCSGGGCVPATGSGRVEIFNNTIWQDQSATKSSGVVVRRDAGGEQPAVPSLRIQNNIIAELAGIGVDIADATVAADGVVLDANLYADPTGERACLVRWGNTCHQSVAALAAATGAEAQGIEGDPLFADVLATPPDLHLRVQSPARDEGIKLGVGDLARDIDRQSRGDKWDIGADEFRCTVDADCHDGNVCNGDERCFGGFCGPASESLDCDDGNVCTIDSCKGATGCVHRPVRDGTACDDADLCTAASACEAGLCVGRNATECPAAGICRVQGGCDPDTGQCLPSPVAPDGTACDDGDACTAGDACRGGQCGGRRCDGDPCLQCTPRGCEPMAPGSFEAVTCAYRRSLTPSACEGEGVPTTVIVNFTTALTNLQEVTAQTVCDGGKRNAYGRASYYVGRALKRLDRTQRPRAKQRLTGGCFSALRSMLADARRRAQTASQTCVRR